MLKEFGIKSESFSLLEAFKKESEKLGAEYHTVFNAFTEANFKAKEGMYFAQATNDTWSLRSEEQEGKILFALTGSLCLAPNSVFTLPEQWNEGLAAIKNLVTSTKKTQFDPNKIYGYTNQGEEKFKLCSLDLGDKQFAWVNCAATTKWARGIQTLENALSYAEATLVEFDDVKEFGKWLDA